MKDLLERLNHWLRYHEEDGGCECDLSVGYVCEQCDTYGMVREATERLKEAYDTLDTIACRSPASPLSYIAGFYEISVDELKERTEKARRGQ